MEVESSCSVVLEKATPKRKRESSSDREEEVRKMESARLQLAKSLQADLVQYLNANSGSRMGTKEHFNFITGKVNQLVQIIKDQEQTQCSLVTIEEKLAKIMDQKEPVAPSYSAVVAGGLKAATRQTRKEVLIIEPLNEQQDAEVTKNILKEKISPSALKIGVKSLRKVKKGALVVEVAQPADKVKLTQAVQNIPGLKARDPKPKRPRVIVMGVPRGVKREELVSLIFEQNEEIAALCVSCDELAQECVPRFQLGNRERNVCSWVLEVSGRLHALLLKTKRLNLEWVRCKIENFVSVLQCFNCCKIGHMAKDCKEGLPTCSQCSDLHRFKECPNKDQGATCINCKLEKSANCRHNAFDRKCPVIQRMKTFLSSRIDYSSS